MSKVSNKNYIVIQGFMLNDLKLKGNELMIYAIIYGFSQAESQWFTGSIQYLADWTNSTKRGVIKNLQSLVEKGYLIKENHIVNGVKFAHYRISNMGNNGIEQSSPGGSEQSSPLVNKVHRGSEQSSPGGSEQSSPYNIDIDIDIDKDKEKAQNQTKSKKIEYIYDIYEQPKVRRIQVESNEDEEYQEHKNQGVGNLGVDVLGVGNQVQINTKEINTKEINTNIKYKRAEQKNYIEITLSSGEKLIISLAMQKIISEFSNNQALRAAIYEFVQMRKDKKAPLTEYSLKLLFNQLRKLSDDESIQIEILDQSTFSHWTRIFPLQEEPKKTITQISPNRAKINESDNDFLRLLEKKALSKAKEI